MNLGDIVYINFPFTDATGAKRRPVLIVGISPQGSNQDEMVVVAEITGSAQRVAYPMVGDFLLDNWKQLNLKALSVLRSRHLFSATPYDLGEKLGDMDMATLTAARAEIKALLQF